MSWEEGVNVILNQKTHISAKMSTIQGFAIAGAVCHRQYGIVTHIKNESEWNFIRATNEDIVAKVKIANVTIIGVFKKLGVLNGRNK